MAFGPDRSGTASHRPLSQLVSVLVSVSGRRFAETRPYDVRGRSPLSLDVFGDGEAGERAEPGEQLVLPAVDRDLLPAGVCTSAPSSCWTSTNATCRTSSWSSGSATCRSAPSTRNFHFRKPEAATGRILGRLLLEISDLDLDLDLGRASIEDTDAVAPSEKRPWRAVLPAHHGEVDVDREAFCDRRPPIRDPDRAHRRPDERTPTA